MDDKFGGAGYWNVVVGEGFQVRCVPHIVFRHDWQNPGFHFKKRTSFFFLIFFLIFFFFFYAYFSFFFYQILRSNLSFLKNYDFVSGEPMFIYQEKQGRIIHRSGTLENNDESSIGAVNVCNRCLAKIELFKIVL